MNRTTKRRAALFLAIAMAFTISIAAAVPLMSAAAAADDLAAQIGALPGLSATAPDEFTVNVGGARANAAAVLNLDIPAGVTVNWGAELSGSIRGAYVLNLTGGGRFVLTSAGAIDNRGTGGALNAAGAGMEISIQGQLAVTGTNGVTLNIAANDIEAEITGASGAVNNDGSNSAINVTNNITGTKINIGGGGSVVSKPSGYAINDGSGQSGQVFDNDTAITVAAGGTVESENASAIRSSGTGSVVTVSGGTVKNAAASNTNSTIYMNGGTGNNIVVSGGEVYTTHTGPTSYVLQTTGNVTVSGGTVRAIAGRAINLVGMDSIATVTNGKVTTVSGVAICTATTAPETVADSSVIITGGVVEATGAGAAIRVTGANSAVSISGGWVTAKQGFAVDAVATATIGVSGGFVFAWGNNLTKAINRYAPTTVTGVGMVVAWNTSTGTGEYKQLDTADLLLGHAGGRTAVWDFIPPNEDDGGVRYNNGANGTDFFPLDVTVIQSAFTLTVVNGTSDGQTELLVKAGDTVGITARDDIPINTTIISPPSVYSTDVPVNGDKFALWTGGGGGTFADGGARATSFTMPAANVTVTAVFDLRHLLQLTGGSIHSDDRSYGSSASYGYYAPGEVIRLVKNSGYGAWAVSAGALPVLVSGLTYEFTMPDAPADIGATPAGSYSPRTFDVKYKIDVVNGTITTTTAGLSVNATHYEGFVGTGLHILADDPPAEEFDYWEISPSVGGGAYFSSSSPATTFIIPRINPIADVTVTAVFKEKLYTLSVENDKGAVVSSGRFPAGAVRPVSATPSPTGMMFSGWTSDHGGEFANSMSAATSFTMPDNDVTVSPHYEYVPYRLAVVGGTDLTRASHYLYGSVVDITADAPPAGRVFDRWVSEGGGTFVNASNANTRFVMPNNDATVTSLYKLPGSGKGGGDTAPGPSAGDDGGGDGGAAGPETRPALPGDVSHMLITERHLAFVQGIGDNLFAPDRDMSRADAAQMFFNLLIDKDVETVRTFSDVPEGAWYKQAVDALASLGIITGSGGLYRPGDPITRAEFVTIAVRFAKEEMGAYGISEFSDVPETHWAHDYIVTAASYGWIQGTGDGRFEPDRHITRAEVVALTNRLLQRIPDESYITGHPDLRFFDDVPETHWAFFYIAEASNSHSEDRDRLEDEEHWTGE